MNNIVDRRIFILGDSHSYTEYNDENGFYSWTWFINEYFKNLKIYNYSVPGGNNLLTDIILKKLLVEEKPSTVILNISGIRRFLVPVSQIDLTWDIKEIKDRYIDCKINGESYFRTANNRVRCGSSFHFKTYKRAVHSLVSNNMSNNCLITTYNRLFANTINLYENQIDNFLYWQFDQENDYASNNIGFDKSVIEFLEHKYGIKKVLKTYLDSTLHLNKEGARLVFEEYILTSKIGQILREINDR